jgi:hypothetical protein
MSMDQDTALIRSISRVLCRAAANGNPCSHCLQGRCDTAMSDSFAAEAVAVIEYLKSQRLLKRWR